MIRLVRRLTNFVEKLRKVQTAKNSRSHVTELIILSLESEPVYRRVIIVICVYHFKILT